MRVRKLDLLMTLSCAIFCCGWAAESALAQCGYATMPFKWRLTENGTTESGIMLFTNVLYTGPPSCDCTEMHRDPDGNAYTHAHLPHGFDFLDGSTTVTVEMSDWAWDADAYFVMQSKISGSTFALNCFAYAAGAPEVIFHSGWEQWTDPSTECGDTEAVKNFCILEHEHAVLITFTDFVQFCPCRILGTCEKMASSGVYEGSWGPLGIVGDHYRKRK